MRFTTDTHTGKRFGWHFSAKYRGLYVPVLVNRGPLHPKRTPRKLLEELNPGVDLDAVLQQDPSEG
jgi:hypothetical protein